MQLKSTKSKSGNPWFYAHRPNATNVVIVLPATEEEVLFLVEERPPLQAENKGKFCIGTCAGLVGDVRDNDTIENAAIQELFEEAGLVAENIKIVCNSVASSAGCVSETSTIVIANIKNKNQVRTPVDDGGVIVDRVWVRKDNIFHWLRQKEEEGYVLTSQVLAAPLYLYE